MTSLRIVAIDGVLGAGKTSVAQKLAARLNLEYLDTGAMYRAIGVGCLHAGLAVLDASSLDGDEGWRLRTHAISVARSAVIDVRTDTLGAQSVRLDGHDVTGEIRSPEAARAASVIATIPEVRDEMVRLQRAWATARGGGVLEGRDIATVVFPGAPVRVFLTADVHERARRRHGEQAERAFADVVSDLEWRDQNDSERAVAPLMIADGATIIDTTTMSLDEVVQRAVDVAIAGFSKLSVADLPRPMSTESVSPGSVRAVGPTPSKESVTRGERRFWAAVRSIVVPICRLYFRVTWSHTERMPASGPVVIAPVHRSNVDTVLVPMLFRRRVRFLGKASMWNFAPLGKLFTRMGAIKVERGTADREAIKLCVEALRGGEPVVVYPEGTRKEGPVVEELFDGVAWLAARTQAVIIPIGIGGSQLAMGRGDRFPKPKRVHLIVGQPIAPPPSTARSGLRACTAELQAELQRLFDEAQTVVHGHVPGA